MTEDPIPNRSDAHLAARGVERLSSQLFDGSPFPAVVSRVRDHTVIAINARTTELIGIPSEEAAGISVSEFYVNPLQRLELVERLRTGGRADNLRIQIKRRNGDPIWVLAASRLITWQEEPAVLTVFHDIGDQLAAEASLRSSGVGSSRRATRSPP